MKIWHDDVRPAPPGWEWARTNNQAIDLLCHNEVDEISLDHDLGYHDIEIPDDPDEMMDILILKGTSSTTGFDLVEWMIKHDKVPAKVTIHSWNPPGAQRMAARLNRFGYDCIVDPFDPKRGW